MELAKPALLAAARARPAGALHLVARPPGRQADAARALVWIIDDSSLELKQICRILENECECVTFSDGASMLEAFARSPPPDVIVVDWQMPGISGLEVVRFLRQQLDEVSLPILMVTVRSDRRDFAEGLSAGANDYVAKPFDPDELVARVRNLTRVRRQAAATRAREQWFQTILRSIGDAVIATDLEGRIEFMNRTAEALTGFPEGDARGMSCDDVCRLVRETTGLGGQAAGAEGSTASLLLDAIGDPARLAEPQRHVLVRPDGTRLDVEVSAVAILSTLEVVGAALVFRDITERLRAEEEASARAEFEQKLVGIVSHDLRNPLQAILLGAEAFLLREDIDPRVVSSAARIRTSASRASRLVSDLLDFTQARIGSGIPIRPRTVDGAQLGVQVIDEVLAVHPEQDVKFEVSGDTVGEWDAGRVSQVLSNLIANAVRYGEEGGTITVSVVGDGDHVLFSVHNEGQPIAEELLPRLFLPMQRGDATAAQAPGAPAGASVGLGLYIVKHIVEAHGGEVRVESSDKDGTRFTARLPRKARPTRH